MYDCQRRTARAGNMHGVIPQNKITLNYHFSIKPILFYFVNKPLSLETGALDFIPPNMYE